MAQDSQSLSYVLTELAAGRNPLPPAAEQTPDVTVFPEPGIGGFPTARNLTGWLDVQLREDPSRRTARLVIDTLDDTATYTFIGNGTPAGYVASPGDTIPDVLLGWSEVITSVLGPAGSNEFTTELQDTDGDGVADVLVVRTIGGSSLSVGTTTTGTAAVTCTADAQSCTVTMYARPRENSNDPHRKAWRVFRRVGGQPLEFAVDISGLAYEVRCAGQDAVFPYVTDLLGFTGDAPSTVIRYSVLYRPSEREAVTELGG